MFSIKPLTGTIIELFRLNDYECISIRNTICYCLFPELLHHVIFIVKVNLKLFYYVICLLSV